MKRPALAIATALLSCLAYLPTASAQREERHHHHSYGGPVVAPGGIGGGATSISGGYAYPLPYGAYGGPIYSGTFFSGTLTIPTGAIYGPQNMQGVMGVDPNPGLGVPFSPLLPNGGQLNMPMANPGAGGQVPGGQAGGGGFGVLAGGGGPAAAPAAHTRVSNDTARARAAQFLGFGDEHFHKQKYNDAYQRYKDSVGSAPDLADGYFREAFALAAMGQYEAAVKAIKRGLQLNADWPATGFRLDDLYGGNQLAKNTHREVLAKAALERPRDADLLFLLAVLLYFDAQPARSRTFFVQAKAVDPSEATHVRVFLDQLLKFDAAKAPRPAARDL